MASLKKLLWDESGASAAEYALMLAIIGSALAIAALTLGQTVADSMDDANGCIDDRDTCS